MPFLAIKEPERAGRVGVSSFDSQRPSFILRSLYLAKERLIWVEVFFWWRGQNGGVVLCA